MITSKRRHFNIMCLLGCNLFLLFIFCSLLLVQANVKQWIVLLLNGRNGHHNVARGNAKEPSILYKNMWNNFHVKDWSPRVKKTWKHKIETRNACVRMLIANTVNGQNGHQNVVMQQEVDQSMLLLKLLRNTRVMVYNKLVIRMKRQNPDLLYVCRYLIKKFYLFDITLDNIFATLPDNTRRLNNVFWTSWAGWAFLDHFVWTSEDLLSLRSWDLGWKIICRFS